MPGIDPDRLYSQQAAIEATGLAQGSLRQMTRSGLKTTYFARRPFYRGDDLISHIEMFAGQPPGPAKGKPPKAAAEANRKRRSCASDKAS